MRSNLMANSEFDLHVWKKPGDPDLYTVGVWDDRYQIVSLCHIQPIDSALAAVRKVLEKAGTREEVSQHEATR
jgi:hypothetical protein